MSAGQPKGGPKAWYDEFTRLFANVLFAVSLFSVWGVLTLIGVIVEQGKDADFYWRNYAPPLARLIVRLHVDNIYHGGAYIGIIGLILTSLTVATFKRVIPKRMPPLRPVKIDAIPLNASVPIDGDESDVRARIEAFFQKRGWQVRKREFGGDEWTFADKHNWARRGVLLAHIGFVVIAAGTTWYWAQGFSGETTILSGESVTIARTGARFTLDRFGYRIDPIRTKSGIVYQPIDYVSRVHVTDRAGHTQDATIRVNQPIDVDGTSYYQAAYGFAMNFTLSKDGIPVAGVPTTPLREGEAFDAGAGRAIQYTQFVGTLDRRTGQPGADPRPNDPAVAVQIVAGEQVLGRALIPLGSTVDLGGGYRLTPQRYTLYTGLQYRFDPGIPLVGIGAFVLLAGLCISFYFLPARLYVRLTGSGNRWDLGIAATTIKGYDVFEEQFRDLIAALRRAEAPVTPGGPNERRPWLRSVANAPGG